MSELLARLGNLCWWASCAVNVLFAGAVLAIGWGSDDLADPLTCGIVVAIMAVIAAIGLGLRYLFAGRFL